MSDYVELRAQSAFSFLHGSSLPEDLAARAAELGHGALALADRDGLYGAPRFYKEARQHGLRALVGADLTLPRGRLLVLVRDRAGYKNLCRLLTAAKAGRPKPETLVTLELLEAHASGLIAITDGRNELDRLQHLFGANNLYLEVSRHFDATEERRLRETVALAHARRLPIVATNDVKYARPAGVDLADVLACIREKTTLDRAGTLLAMNAERHLKAPAEMAALFRDLPQAIANTADIAGRCTFTLEDLGYRFPDYPLPPGETPSSYLAHLTREGARRRYRPITPRVQAQLERELRLIAKLELAGYFLIVWDIVEFCRREGILVQGRGSAANSAVCYALGITAVDPIGMDLLFERFLSEERGEWPDIDLDLPSGDQREKVIQHMYRKYGAAGCAMTANCITYRARSSVREVGKVLGFEMEQLDRISKRIGPFEYRLDDAGLTEHLSAVGITTDGEPSGARRGASDEAVPRRMPAGIDPRVRQLLRLTSEIQGLPRHLGQHSGGMVMCQGRLDEVVPLEPASMPGRVVVQWDKDDCADLGIIKVDLLGLGMMAVLEEAVPLVKAHDGVEVDLAHLPPNDPETYRLLQTADTVGVFQVESRAQMATLPRMRPERFYDIVVEVAIIRPGPIVGQMVHPYLARRQGRQPVAYAHPSLEPILARTLGVPLFQEQLMRIAMVAAGFTGGEAEELRRAMGSKRSVERMKQLEAKLRAGMSERGITGAAQDEIVQSIHAFALYGFPESHSASFALLVYASTYLKAHHPAAFTCALLNNWPMGFYHPATLITDARRHGVRVLPIDVTRSDWKCTLEPDAREGARSPAAPRGTPSPSAQGRANALRLGLKYVAGLREATAHRLVAARTERPFSSVSDLWRRAQPNAAEMITLASIGSLNALGVKRRGALWQATALGRSGPLFNHIDDQKIAREARGEGEDRPAVPDEGEREGSPLNDMSLLERLAADFRGTSVTTGPHPLTLYRDRLRRRGIHAAGELAVCPDGARVQVAGSVIVRQRPGTAKGFFFLTLEDETGFSNAIVTPQVFARNRSLLTGAAALIVGGVLQNQDNVVSVKADRFWTLEDVQRVPSRDFH
jgi:error-prone DNA polymerase